MSDQPIHDRLGEVVDRVIAETSFSGVVRIDRSDQPPFERAAGFADRRWAIPMTIDTRLGVASATKGFTGLAVMALVEAGTLDLDTAARDLLGDDLPLIDDRVTIEHLLAHRSGIGDYLDEEAMGSINDYAMPVPVHQLDGAESCLRVLDGYPQVFPPGSHFTYNNGAFVVLALIAQRAAGRSYYDLVDEFVVRPAGLTDTSFVRSDALPPGAATSYLEVDGLRTNALHMPLRGVGDGGLYSTAADWPRFWRALFEGYIVGIDTVAMMTSPRSDAPENNPRYGLAFWLDATGPGVFLEGYDAGISFRSLHDPTTGTTRTVISNWSDGAWDVLRAIAEIVVAMSNRWRHPGATGAVIYAVAAGLLGAVVTIVSRLQIAGVRGRAEIVEALPDGPVIVISNHTSYADGVLLALVCRRLGRSARMLATAGVFRVPVLGGIVRRIGFIPVERGTDQAADSLGPAAEALAAGEVVALFPEGRLTRDPNQWPEKAKTGSVRLALRTGAPIVPVAMEGAHRVLGRRHVISSVIANVLLRPKVETAIGEPIDVRALVVGEETPQEIRRVTDIVMSRLIDLIEQLRDEQAPAESGVDRVAD